MKTLKRMIALSTVVAMCGSAIPANAQEFVSEVAGAGYEEARRSPSLTPAIALGAIALIAVIAVAVQNSSHGGGCHGHCHD